MVFQYAVVNWAWSSTHHHARSLDLFYKIRKDLFEKLKAKEHGIWSGKNIKASTEKVKPLHIYALMHANIVRLLNE